MSRTEGFDVMDVSTALHNDPKVKRLAREHPEQLGPGFLVYLSTVAESWQAGERVTVEDGWPGYLAFDEATVEALKDVRLLDSKGMVPLKSWRGWFDVARARREKTRERWRRANANRHQSTDDPRSDDSDQSAQTPRGSRADTQAIPSVRPYRPSDSESVRRSVVESSPSREADGQDIFGTTTTNPSGKNNRPEKIGDILPRVAAQGARR